MQSMWPRRPVIYEINTWTWLYDLSQRYQRDVTLGNVPAEEWERIAAPGVDAVWLMGVWERSPRSAQVSNENVGQQAEFEQALADYTLADNIGSAYSVRRYVVDKRLGGPKGLAVARQTLARHGLRLLLDFVPNHVALDHLWVSRHPDYCVQGTSESLASAPEAFFMAGKAVIANGRDPYFPAWRDVAQLNAFSPALRQAARRALLAIGKQCDGVRCDMAMLLLNTIFTRTWGQLVGEAPPQEYWREVIDAVRRRYPDMLFVAEVYWDLEYTLQQLGFNYCYDKRLYDQLEHATASAIRSSLTADVAYQDGLIRFIENHDERRAAATFPIEKEQAAAVIIMTVPGATLLYDGQFEGKRIRLPVFLRRGPHEDIHTELSIFYRCLLGTVHHMGLHAGAWRLCQCTGWPDNTSFEHLLAWTWETELGRTLIVINYSEVRAEGRIHLPWSDLAGRTWHLADSLNNDQFERDGEEMHQAGLYVDLPAWGVHFLRVEHV